MRISTCFASALLTAALHAQGLPPVPIPPQNPITPNKVELGRALFWDEQLSSTGTVSCGTCHIPTAGGGDPRQALTSLHPGLDGSLGTADDVVGSPGVPLHDATGRYTRDPFFGLQPQVTDRNAPTMINAAFAPSLFWDGRASATFLDPETGVTVLANRGALESQAAGPPLSDVEMGHVGRDWQDVIDRVTTATPLALAEDVPADLAAFVAGNDYPTLFASAFGTPDVSAARIAMAIATYERTLLSDETPFDQGALTQQEQRGLAIFNGPGRCNLCHSGPLFTDNDFHNIGVRPIAEDDGRAGVTGQPQDAGRFKTPGLRNVGLSAPYFHGGSAATLADVVDFYNRGGDFPQNQDPLIQPLGLAPPQRADLVAFLATGLLDARVANETGPFERPTLYAESTRVPSSFGIASAGSGGFAPELVALEPPLLGNANMTVGLEHATPGSLYYLLADTPGGGIDVLGARLYFGFTSNLTGLHSGAAQGTGFGAGFDAALVQVPNDPAFAGLALTFQWIGFDAGAPGGLSASAPVNVVPF